MAVYCPGFNLAVMWLLTGRQFHLVQHRNCPILPRRLCLLYCPGVIPACFNQGPPDQCSCWDTLNS